MNNGKEFIEMYGYDEYDLGFRSYYPALGRFTTIDPLSELSYSTSPYAFAGNNPMNNVDILGLAPIQPHELNYTVVDKNGIIIAHVDDNDHHVYMDKDGTWDGTKGGLSDLSIVGFEDPKLNYNNLINTTYHYYNPVDAGDVELTSGDYLFYKTYLHFLFGGQQPIFIDVSTLNLGDITQADLNIKDGKISIDLYKLNPTSQTSLALGKLSLTDKGNNCYSINPDYYDFNIEWQNGITKRNIATAGAAILHYNTISLTLGGPFGVDFQGTITIK